MIISHSKKFVFIHHPKTAGSSIGSCLSSVCEGGDIIAGDYSRENLSVYKPSIFYQKKHAGIAEIKEMVPIISRENYFTFGFARNPFYLAFSAFRYFKRTKPTKNWKWTSKERFKSLQKMNFNQYINSKWYARALTMHDTFFDSDGKPLNFIGRFEDINSDLLKIYKKIGLKEFPKTPHKNRSPLMELNLREIYNDKSIKIVETKNKKDLEYFNYDFA